MLSLIMSLQFHVKIAMSETDSKVSFNDIIFLYDNYVE